MFGHAVLGTLFVLLVLNALSAWTRLFDGMRDRTYTMLTWLLGWGGGGLLGMFPDLLGYYTGNPHFDLENPVISILCGGHWFLDEAYAYYGIANNSLVGYTIELMLFFLSVTATVAIMGLTDAAAHAAGEDTDTIGLKKAVRRGASYMATYPLPSVPDAIAGVLVGAVPIAGVILGISWSPVMGVYAVLYIALLLASLDLVLDAICADHPLGSQTWVVLVVLIGVPAGAWAIVQRCDAWYAVLYVSVVLATLVAADLLMDRLGLSVDRQRRKVEGILARLPKEVV